MAPSWTVALLALSLAGAPARGRGPGDEGEAGFRTINAADIAAHLREIAAPELEGRASPSEGLTRAAAYIERRFREAGLNGAGAEGSFRTSYFEDVVGPDDARCALSWTKGGADGGTLVLEKDFVPLPGCAGEAAGPLVFAGFGITGTKEHYDDLKGTRVKGRVVLILEGEPRHKRLFEGAEVTAAADAYAKVAALAKEGALGVLVVRRAPPPTTSAGDAPVEPVELGYRYQWAEWNPALVKPMPPVERKAALPVLEVTEAAASALLGEDVAALAAQIDQGGKPIRREPAEVVVSLSAGFRTKSLTLENVAGIVRGTDPTLAQEYVVLGAHYDHIGVDPLGRIGCGADDNGSGTSALIELAEAFAKSPPRRSILCAAFSAEEEGLIGSGFFADKPPVPPASLVVMLNMDMIGRVEPDQVVVIGLKQNPELEDVLKRAQRLRATGLKKVVTGKAEEFWDRSDQYSFHKKGVPVLFFFEAAVEADNPDYHTFRDTIERLDTEKVARIARLVFNTAWILAQDDGRPPAPR